MLGLTNRHSPLPGACFSFAQRRLPLGYFRLQACVDHFRRFITLPYAPHQRPLLLLRGACRISTLQPAARARAEFFTNRGLQVALHRFRPSASRFTPHRADDLAPLQAVGPRFGVEVHEIAVVGTELCQLQVVLARYGCLGGSPVVALRRRRPDEVSGTPARVRPHVPPIRRW